MSELLTCLGCAESTAPAGPALTESRDGTLVRHVLTADTRGTLCGDIWLDRHEGQAAGMTLEELLGGDHVE